MAKNKYTLEIPTSLDDIPLYKYQRYISILSKHQDESGEVKEESMEFIHRKMVEIFCGVDMQDLFDMPVAIFDVAISALSRIFQEKPPLHKWVDLHWNDKKVKIGFIPNLEEISLGEYVDVDSYITSYETMHKAMAVLYRPVKGKIGKFYEIEDYEGSDVYADMMRLLPMTVVMGAQLFFYRLGNDLLEASRHFLTEEKEALDQKIISLRNGVGTVISTHSPEAISSKWMKSQESV